MFLADVNKNVLVGRGSREHVTFMLFVVPALGMNLLSPRGTGVYHTAGIGAVQEPFQAHFSRYCWVYANTY